MKKIKITLMIAFTFVLIDSALADNFQFILENTKTYISSAEVRVYDQNGLIYKGETSKYGKISLDLRPGNYSLEISFNKKRFVTNIEITGYSSGFRRVYLD